MVRLFWFLLVFPGLLLGGWLYQRMGALNDRRRFLGLGKLVEVGNGRRMYVSDRGAGGPTVVFESGIAATSQNWAEMQELVSGFARTVTYDRAGLGWSSPSNWERTPSRIVSELRTMLLSASIEPPYVLVGHSFGGFVVRHYAAEYPDEVAGVVLLDAMRVEDWPPVNERQRAMLERGQKMTRLAIPIAQFGLARLATTSLLCRSGTISGVLSRVAGEGGKNVLDRVSCEVGKMPREVWPIVAAHWAAPEFYRGLAAHLEAVPASVREMERIRPIAGPPVVLLTPESAEPLTLEGLRRIGTDTRQVIVAGSGHWVHLDQPQVVLEEIRTMVEQVTLPVPLAVEAVWK